MKDKFRSLLRNELLLLLLNGVFATSAFSAVVIAVLQVPPEEILDSSLVEVIKVFED